MSEFPNFCELTFVTEGGNLPVVLKVHWPGGVSGVTIGPGYDMGQREESAVKADLIDAGVPAADAEKLCKGAGKTGDTAGTWVTNNKPTLPKISVDASKKLFEHVYPTYVGRAKGVTKAWGCDWEKFPQRMKEVLVDLSYRGDFWHNSSKGTDSKHKPKLLPSMQKADYAAFRAAIRDYKYWQQNTNLGDDKNGNPNNRITARGNWLLEDGGDVEDAAPPAPPPGGRTAFQLNAMAPDQLYDHLQAVWKRLQDEQGKTEDVWKFQEDNGRINLMGVRGLLSDVAPSDPGYLAPTIESRDQWHDTMLVIYKDKDGRKKVEVFPCCTFPNTEDAEHTIWSTLQLGFHRYRIGQHMFKRAHQAEDLSTVTAYLGKEWGYRALKPILAAGEKNVFFVTAKSNNSWLDEKEGDKESDDLGINIHFGGEKGTPTGWSLGCQVIKCWASYRRFIGLLEGDASIKRCSAADELAGKAPTGDRPVIYLLTESSALRPPGIGLPVGGVGDPKILYDLNEKGEGGYFPIAANNFWHGGIHLDTEKPIVAVADGEVVAYRINKEPVQIELGGAKLPLSTSFVLVHHERWTPKGQKIDFFSLYMHLLPLGAYTEEQKAQAPSPFKKRKFTVRIKEDGCGLNVRDGADRETIKGVIPRGAWFEVADSKDVAAWSASYVKVKYSGPDGDVEGYASITGRSKKVAGKPTTYVCDTKEDKPADESKLGLNVRENKTGSRLVRVAPFGAELKIKNPQEVAPGGKVALDKWVELEGGGWVYTSADKEIEGSRASLAVSATAEPDEYDKVVKTKLPIQAGSVVGHPGPYFVHEKTVHFEILTGDVEFMTNPKGDKSEANTLEIAAGTVFKKRTTKSEKVQVDLEIGTVLKLVQKGRADARKVILDELMGWAPRSALGDWKKETEQYTLLAPLASLATAAGGAGTIAINAAKGAKLRLYDQSGDHRLVGYTPSGSSPKTGWALLAQLGTPDGEELYTLTQPLPELLKEEPGTNYELTEDAGKNDAAIAAPILASGDPAVWKDKQGKVWQEIEFAPDTKGWVQRDAPGVKATSAYDWPGWQRVEEHGDFSDDGLCDATDLVALIDADGNGDVSSPELKKALEKPAVATRLRRVACVHPTEWAGEVKGLERLSGPPWSLGKEYIDATKDYIKKLGFWSDLTDVGLPAKDKVWNLHPIGFLEQLDKLSVTRDKPPPCVVTKLVVTRSDNETPLVPTKARVIQLVAESPFKVSTSFSTEDGPSLKVKAGDGSFELRKGDGPSSRDVLKDLKKLGVKKTLEKYRDKEEQEKKEKAAAKKPGAFDIKASAEFAMSPPKGMAELHLDLVTARKCDEPHPLQVVSVADGKITPIDPAKPTVSLPYNGTDGPVAQVKPQRYTISGAGCDGGSGAVTVEVFPASTALAKIDFEAERDCFDKVIKNIDKVLKGLFNGSASLKIFGGVSGFRGWREADDGRVYNAREFTAEGGLEVTFKIKLSFLKFFPIVPESLVRYVADIGLFFKVTGGIKVEGQLEQREYPAAAPSALTTKAANGSLKLTGSLVFEIGLYAELHLVVISAEATGKVVAPLKAGGELKWNDEKMQVSPFVTLEEGQFKVSLTVESWLTKSEYEWEFKAWDEQQFLKDYTWTIYDHTPKTAAAH
ncbi:EF hand domain protein [Minicystis rosea]|nr:EF hand domain protein [Minicystis rosea]